MPTFKISKQVQYVTDGTNLKKNQMFIFIFISFKETQKSYSFICFQSHFSKIYPIVMITICSFCLWRPISLHATTPRLADLQPPHTPYLGSWQLTHRVFYDVTRPVQLVTHLGFLCRGSFIRLDITWLKLQILQRPTGIKRKYNIN